MKAQHDIYEEGGPKTKDSREQKHLSTLEPIAEPISWQCYSGWLEAQQIWHKGSQLPNIGEEKENPSSPLQDLKHLIGISHMKDAAIQLVATDVFRSKKSCSTPIVWL